jgi:hypothetical protein
MKNVTYGLDNFNIGEHHCDDYSVSAPDTILVRSVGVISQDLGVNHSDGQPFHSVAFTCAHVSNHKAQIGGRI